MIDKREAILSRLVEVCESIPGIAAVARNALDVASLARPALLVIDGSEQRLDAPQNENFSRAMRVNLSPPIWLLVRGSPADVGPLMSLYRSKLVYAVTNDETLRDLTTLAGAINYNGCTVSEPTPEAKELRMDINFTLRYPLMTGDLLDEPITTDITGTLISTEAGDVAVISGSEAMTGAMAATEPIDIAAFVTAGTEIAGTFSASEAGDTAVFIGGIVIAGNLTAEITFPGGVPTASVVVFDQSTGTDIGNYVAPSAGFTQHCIRARNALLPHFFVDFRPDNGGLRDEVVFWYGETDPSGLTVASGYFNNLPAYNCVIKKGGTPIADYLGTTTHFLPWHNWGNRWRHESAKRPFIRTAAQVFSGHFLPNMDQASARISGTNTSTGQPWSGLPYTDVASGGHVIVPPILPAPSSVTHDGYNGDGSAMTQLTDGPVYIPFMAKDRLSFRCLGIDCNGDDGGFRPELGLITEWQADWLLRGTATSRNTMIQQAEFFSSQANGIFIPDLATGGPVNQKLDAARYKATMLAFGSYYYVENGSASGGFTRKSSGHFTGSVSATTLTVTTSPGGAGVKVGMWLDDDQGTIGITPGTLITAQLTGATGDIGTYTVSKSQTCSSRSLIAYATTGEYASKGNEHVPQACYVPWLATEDSYYCEGAQYHETFASLSNILHKDSDYGNLASDPTGATGFNGAYTVGAPNPVQEERAWAWLVKNVASNYVMAPTSPPSWLLPKSYWSAISSDISATLDKFIANDVAAGDQYRTVFHTVDCGGHTPGVGLGDAPQSFYKAYVCSCWGFADLVGLPVPAAAGHSAPSTWLQHLDYVFDWFRNTADPATSSGWNVQNPIAHDLNPNTISNLNPTSGCTASTTSGCATGSNCYSTYAALWTANATWLNASAPYPSNPSPGFIGTNTGNLTLVLSGARIAESRGISGAAAVATFIGHMIDYSFPQPLAAQQVFRCADGFNGT